MMDLEDHKNIYELQQYEYGKDLAAEGTIDQEAYQMKLSRGLDERVIINVPADGSYVEILGHRIDGFESFEAFLEHLKKYDELERKNIVNNEIIKSCLEFIDKLLPSYMNEKHHIIMGDDWELNRSIYVMSELRDRLMGYVKDGKTDKKSADAIEALHNLQQYAILYKHRLDVANEYIESRKKNMVVDHYNDLKYILNECDLESSW